MLDVYFKPLKKEKFDNNNVIVLLMNNTLKINIDINRTNSIFYSLVHKIIQKHGKIIGEFSKISKFCIPIDQEGNTQSILIVGIGEESLEVRASEVEELGAKIYLNIQQSTIRKSTITILMNDRVGNFSAEETAALIASGAILSSYNFSKYKTQSKEHSQSGVQVLNIIVEHYQNAHDIFQDKKSVAMGVYFARDLTNEVPNILYPASYAERIVQHLRPLGVNVNVIDEQKMHSWGMGALLGVAQGSAHESKLVVMHYNGTEDNETKPVCFVGKGVTFDTGGISLKPSSKMELMKYDMGGSAAVVGTIKSLALRKAKTHVVGVVGLVENMPGANAQRPGDVITTMSGQTVEVLNTDAEGRLVLCDCITYLQNNFVPECIIDIATLTGAIIISLASSYAGCFANNDQLANNLIQASNLTNEKLWRMPLHKDYNKMLESPIADMANIGNEQGAAGSSTAAHFIERFIKDGTKWAHLDIAGVAWNTKDNDYINPKGATGFGVRLLNQFIKTHYESR